jgi:hypothetical protein
VTAEMPPSAESARPPRRRSEPASTTDGVAIIAVIAFVFGVFLNGYIALSILGNDGSTSSPSANDAPQIVPAAPTATATATQTPLPDRTDCDEIRGTDYRSGAEREYFLSNCLNLAEETPTPDPDAPALDGGTSAGGQDENATPTPEP